MELVSVIMPCYNDGKYIEEAVASVFNQTYPLIELIIIDDGSDDPATVEIINQLESPRIHVLRTDHVRPAGARNYGIAHANGTYILPLDSDDTIDPEYISKAAAILENRPEVGAVYCYADLFGEKKGRWELPDYSIDHMLLDNVVFVTSLFRKSDWEAIGGFNVHMKNGMEDYDFWLSVLELDKEIYQIPEVLFHYRIKPVSRTTNFMQSMETVQETYRRIYGNHPRLYEKYRHEYAVILRDQLIHQIFLVRRISENKVVKTVFRFPLFRRIAKFFIK